MLNHLINHLYEIPWGSKIFFIFSYTFPFGYVLGILLCWRSTISVVELQGVLQVVSNIIFCVLFVSFSYCGTYCETYKPPYSFLFVTSSFLTKKSNSGFVGGINLSHHTLSSTFAVQHIVCSKKCVRDDSTLC